MKLLDIKNITEEFAGTKYHQELDRNNILRILRHWLEVQREVPELTDDEFDRLVKMMLQYSNIEWLVIDDVNSSGNYSIENASINDRYARKILDSILSDLGH